METENLVEIIMNVLEYDGILFPCVSAKASLKKHLKSVIKYAKESVWVSVNSNEPEPINRFTVDESNVMIEISPSDMEQQPIYICHDLFRDKYFMARPYKTSEGLSWCDMEGNRLCDIDNVDYYMIIPKLPKNNKY